MTIVKILPILLHLSAMLRELSLYSLFHDSQHPGAVVAVSAVSDVKLSTV